MLGSSNLVSGRVELAQVRDKNVVKYHMESHCLRGDQPSLALQQGLANLHPAIPQEIPAFPWTLVI